MDTKDSYCGIRILWSWDYRFWSWFNSHGIESAYYGAEHAPHNCYNCGKYLGYRTVKAANRVYDKVYHLGPLKIWIGVVK